MATRRVCEGADVIDVGCGPGAFIPALADEVGDAGSVLGTDADPEAVARAQAVASGLARPNVAVRLGRATDTGVEQASYDIRPARGARLPGRLRLVPRRPGARGPAWAARGAMVAEGDATEDDVHRWEIEFGELDACAEQPTHILAGFGAVGRKPHSS